MADPKLDWSEDLKEPKLNRLVRSLRTELAKRPGSDDSQVVPLGSTTDQVITALQALGLFTEE